MNDFQTHHSPSQYIFTYPCVNLHVAPSGSRKDGVSSPLLSQPDPSISAVSTSLEGNSPNCPGTDQWAMMLSPPLIFSALANWMDPTLKDQQNLSYFYIFLTQSNEVPIMEQNLP